MIRVDHEQAADLVGSVVEVYRNLHRGLWSVRLRGGRVVAHLRTLVVERATFHVQPAGRARVLRDGRKNVHAWVRGVYVEPDFTEVNRALYQRGTRFLPDGRVVRGVSYNPKLHEGFFICAGGPNQRALVSADAVYFGDGDAHAINPVPKETP